MNNQERDKAEQQNETKTRFEWLFQQHRILYENRILLKTDIKYDMYDIMKEAYEKG